MFVREGVQRTLKSSCTAQECLLLVSCEWWIDSSGSKQSIQAAWSGVSTRNRRSFRKKRGKTWSARVIKTVYNRGVRSKKK